MDGIVGLHALLAEQMPAECAEIDPAEAPAMVKVGIETDRGPWVAALVAARYEVFPINPLSVARYWERHCTSGAKSDAAARILGEFGDAPDRYPDAKARKNYAGTSPITRASGTKKVVLTRYARNRRLGDAWQQWALCSLRGSPGARAYYRQLRARNIGHQAALRQLANRLVGILHGCLKSQTQYDENTAWAHILNAAA